MRSAFTIPKLLFLLRTAPCFQSQLLSEFDSLQRSLLESFCNISLNDLTWTQASLPINSGGLGIRSAVLLAPCAFLASAAGCGSLSLAILPERFTSVNGQLRQEALNYWSHSVSSPTAEPPRGISATHQKAWDKPVIERSFSTLITNADQRTKARLLASQQKESGAWLSAPPVSSLGLRMSDDSIRIAISLRLGCTICAPHKCSLCGNHVDASGLHGLSCRRSVGRIPRHTQLNIIIKEALKSASIPSILEPQGLSRTDGKRPDGLSIIPWANGRLLAWDATCWDSFAPSHIYTAASGPGALADMAAQRKLETYKDISQSHVFIPVALESTGAFGSHASDFFHQLAARIRSVSNDPLEYLKLCQRISICIQNFNCASILGCCS